MIARVLLLLALVAAVTAEGQSREDHYGHYPDEAQYEYHYNVHDYDNNHGKQESRQGSRTHGSFYVYLPNGLLQKVYYHVDGDTGFVAEVTYESHDSYRSREEAYDEGDT